MHSKLHCRIVGIAPCLNRAAGSAVLCEATSHTTPCRPTYPRWIHSEPKSLVTGSERFAGGANDIG